MRLPWKIKIFLETCNSVWKYYLNKTTKYTKNSNQGSILFYCRYEGLSGGSIAVATIAKMISTFKSVEFLTRPTNALNNLYFRHTQFVSKISKSYDIIICDDTTPSEEIEYLKAYANQVWVSCHCLLEQCHGRKPDDMRATLEAAHKVQFVDKCQQESFHLAPDKYFVIPNAVQKVNKTSNTKNVGCVGDLDQKRKNVETTISIFERSLAEKLHLWRISTVFEKTNVISHFHWENNKEKIFNSFDVLIFPSRYETFGLVIAEALSAGIPCVISDIPAFEQYKACEAVRYIANNSVEQGAESVNELLLENTMKSVAINFWETHFSPEVIVNKWVEAFE